MKINFRRYLYIFSIALFLTSIYVLDFILALPYSFGGIKYFDDLNRTLPYIQYNVGTVIFKIICNLILKQKIPN